MMRGLLSLLLALVLATGAVPLAAQTDVTQAQAEPETEPAAEVEAEPGTPTETEQTPGAETGTGTGAIDFDAWESEAERIETLLEAGTASTSFFQNLRATLVDWRGRLLVAQDANASRIATLEAQIAALGPVPEDGSPEPDAIAERRAQLEGRLADARVPQVNAAAAFTRADGLIQEIDALLRDRQQEQLLRLDPTPLNPVNWAVALTSMRDLAVVMQREISNRISDPVRRMELADSAPVIAFLVLLGLLALFRGRRWTERLTERLQARARVRGRTAVAFLVSLLQITVPIAGVLMFLTALVASGMVGPQMTAILESVAGLAVAVYVSLWLAGRLFRDDADDVFATLRADRSAAMAARRVVVSVGVAVGLTLVVETITDLDQVPPAAHGVLLLPVYVLMGYLFWRASRLLRSDFTERGEDEGPGFQARALTLVANILVVIAVIGPTLAAIGYINATQAVMVPTANSLALIGLLLALQPVVRDLYAVVLRTTPEAAGDALVPVLVNFLLVFAALPLFALIWGARPETLGDVYARFWEGLSIGDARITPSSILAVAVIFGLGVLATRLLQGALKSTVLPRTRLDTGARTAVTSGVGYVGIGLAAVIAITAGGIDLTALGVVLGALSVGIGFGLQNVVNNFVSGIILLIERPISEGDWIEVNGTMGIVKDISVRSTRIETFDRTDVIVPNADFISGTVTNWTRGNTVGRAIITVGVAYGTDTRRVEKILAEVAREHPVVAAFPEPGVDFLGFGADSLDFRIRAILRDVNQLLAVKTEIHHRIAERFAEEGIEIPFAQRDIWLRNPEALRPAAQVEDKADDTDKGPDPDTSGAAGATT
jgi:small-conductance mechanosensitive channel